LEKIAQRDFSLNLRVHRYNYSMEQQDVVSIGRMPKRGSHAGAPFFFVFCSKLKKPQTFLSLKFLFDILDVLFGS